MIKELRSTWHFRGVISFFFWLITLMILVSGCGGGGKSANETGPSSTQSGAARLSINWHSAHSNLKQAESDCFKENIADVICYVYENSDTLLTESDILSCPASDVTINGITAGEDRMIVCMGLDQEGRIDQLGQISDVAITAGQTTDVGSLDAYPFIAKPGTPEDGMEVAVNKFSLNWSSVPNAYQYQVIMAEDPQFNTLLLDELTTRTTLAPSILLSESTYYWKVVPLDPHGHQGMDSISIQCKTEPGVSCRKPTMDAIGRIDVNAGETVTFTLTASDPDDGDQLTFSSGPLPAGASFDEDTGEFTWVTTADDVGWHKIRFKVCDNCPSGSLCDYEKVFIVVGQPCEPPELDPIGPRQVNEEELLTFIVNAAAYSPDDELIYRAIDLPEGASFNTETRTFSWTPEVGSAGNYEVKFKACNDCPDGLACDWEIVTITVGNVCRPPDFEPIGDQSVVVGESLEFSVQAIDPDTESILTYSAEDVDQGRAAQYFDPQTLAFQWTPQQEDAGTHQIKFTVCDDCPTGPLCDEENIVVSVVEPEVETPLPPELITPEEGFEMDNGCVDVVASADPIIWDFTWSSVPNANHYELSILLDGVEVLTRDTTDTQYSYICFEESDEIINCTIDASQGEWSWRVRAGNGDTWSDWSLERTFVVESIDPHCQLTEGCGLVDVLLDPAGPAVLAPDTRIELTINYTTPYAKEAYVTVTPYYQGNPLPLSAYSATFEEPFPEAYETGEGQAFLIVNQNNTVVDEIRVEMLYQDGSYCGGAVLPVRYRFTTGSTGD